MAAQRLSCEDPGPPLCLSAWPAKDRSKRCALSLPADLSSRGSRGNFKSKQPLLRSATHRPSTCYVIPQILPFIVCLVMILSIVTTRKRAAVACQPVPQSTVGCVRYFPTLVAFADPARRFITPRPVHHLPPVAFQAAYYLGCAKRLRGGSLRYAEPASQQSPVRIWTNC